MLPGNVTHICLGVVSKPVAAECIQIYKYTDIRRGFVFVAFFMLRPVVIELPLGLCGHLIYTRTLICFSFYLWMLVLSRFSIRV